MGLTPRSGRSGRLYDWEDRSYISVTTILGCLNKPALPSWAAKTSAEFVVKNFDTIAGLMRTGQQKAAVDLIKGSPWRQRDKAADLGTAVHHAVEALQGGKPYEPTEHDVIPYLDSFVQWYDHFQPRVLYSEGTVFNTTYDYAGTLDLIAEIGDDTWLIDVKTGKGVYPEYAMQICAYAKGEFIGMSDGKEEPMPHVTKGAVLHLQKTGYSFIPVSIEDEVWQSFLYAREMFRWQDDIAHRVIQPEVRK